MKVNGVNSVKNDTSFMSARKRYNSNPQCSCKRDDGILATGLVALGILGAATVLNCVAKKNNMSAPQFIKHSFNKAKAYLSDKPEPDFLNVLIKNKRDANAVKSYKGYRAKKKMESLHKRLLSGEFDGKSKEVFNRLRRNEIKLRREASFVG